jgi:hypothetical protein
MAPGQKLSGGELANCNAQINSGIAFLTGLTGTVPRTGDQDLFFPKLDWHINQNNIFFCQLQ